MFLSFITIWLGFVVAAAVVVVVVVVVVVSTGPKR